MRYLDAKNKKIRFFTKKTETKTFIYKSIQANANFGQLLKLKAYNLLVKLLVSPFHRTAFVKRCILSRRKKKINNFINVSRLVFLNFARFGELYGIRKAVW